MTGESDCSDRIGSAADVIEADAALQLDSNDGTQTVLHRVASFCRCMQERTTAWVKNGNVWVKSENSPGLQVYDFIGEISLILRGMWLRELGIAFRRDAGAHYRFRAGEHSRRKR